MKRKYLPREESKLEALRRLDAQVKNAGMIEGLCFGIIGVLIFGVGICFLLHVFAGAAWLSVLLMTVGSLIMIPAYPIYKKIARKTKKELTPDILRLSEEIISTENF